MNGKAVCTTGQVILEVEKVVKNDVKEEVAAVTQVLASVGQLLEGGL